MKQKTDRINLIFLYILLAISLILMSIQTKQGMLPIK